MFLNFVLILALNTALRSIHSSKYVFGDRVSHFNINDTPGNKFTKLFCASNRIIKLVHFIIAPGHYMVEKVNLGHAPKYSFGIKTIEKKTSDSPGKYFF